MYGAISIGGTFFYYVFTAGGRLYDLRCGKRSWSMCRGFLVILHGSSFLTRRIHINKTQIHILFFFFNIYYYIFKNIIPFLLSLKNNILSIMWVGTSKVLYVLLHMKATKMNLHNLFYLQKHWYYYIWFNKNVMLYINFTLLKLNFLTLNLLSLQIITNTC